MTDFVFKNETDENQERIQSVKENEASKENKEPKKINTQPKGLMSDEEYAKLLRDKRKKLEGFNNEMMTSFSCIDRYAQQDPRFKYRRVNDKPGRIRTFQDRGWDLVYDESLAKDVGQTDVKGPIMLPTGDADCPYAYLMRIPAELFNEAQEVKDRENKKRIDQINGENEEKFGDVINNRTKFSMEINNKQEN